MILLKRNIREIKQELREGGEKNRDIYRLWRKDRSGDDIREFFKRMIWRTLMKQDDFREVVEKIERLDKLEREYKDLFYLKQVNETGMVDNEALVARARLIDIDSYFCLQARKGMIKCPFHAEKTASCKLYGNSFHCFGCKAGGDAIEFCMRYKGLNFIQAVKFLNNV